MLLAVRDRQQAALTFEGVLGARTIREDDLRLYSATRTVLQAGESQFELLEPAGDGALSAHLDRWGEGIFAAGFSTDDPSLVARRMADRNLHFTEEAGQIFIGPDQTRGMRTVISRPHENEPAGLISYIYEVTNIVDDHEESARFYADTFGLDASRFSPIKSEQWGYVGTLTLFNPPERLDRIELTQTTEPSLAMGRFYARRGQSIYMCYVEADDTGAIRDRLESRGDRYTAGRENGGGNLFIHPTALHGMLMGVSRKNLAWTWSGRPELARAG
jgi:catechol 2,3-dioxygenase-like lactoylglutathione lyase family enzyme